jgi:hypothetical protein
MESHLLPIYAGPIRRQEIAGHLWTGSTDGQALTLS